MHLTIGVTGHRDLVESELPGLRNQARQFFSGLAEAFPGLKLQLISPLAEGSDRLVAEVALELGVELVVTLPMTRNEYEKDFAASDSLRQFRDLLEHAEVITLPMVNGNNGVDHDLPDAERDRQYMQMGVFISNHCQILLALWDGKPAADPGGTAAVVDYHLTAVMPGYVLPEESPNLLADNENDLVYHITVSRDRPDGAPAEGTRPLDAGWITGHYERSPTDCMPAKFRNMLARLQDFTRDIEHYAPLIEEQGGGLLAGAPGLGIPGGVELVDRLFRRADWLAVHFQKRFNQGMLGIHALAVTMGLVFIIYAEFESPAWLVYMFLVLFFSGVLVHQLAERRQWHRKYLDYRALAEGLRVQLYWSLAGVVETQSAVFAYDNFLQKQDVDLGWIRHVMRSASLHRDRHSPPDERWVAWVVSQWVGEESADTGQLAYYRHKSVLKAANYRRTTRLGALALWLGIFFATVLAFSSGEITETQRNLLLVLMGVLPLIAGVRDAYSHKKAERELIKQYRFMGRVFANARRLLDASKDLRFKRRVLKAVGNAALEEHAEWLLMHRERPLEHGGL
jgi:hypothetical protein